ncbi:MAG: GNAT family N-acetyltransferase [Clostridia bacterium]|nr:GNAT family N-acetyltransferase [Clostridia bacterium]
MSIRKSKYLETPLLATPRLILRKFTLDDAMDVYEYAKEPEVAKYVTWEAHKSIGDAVSFINWAQDRYASDSGGDWGIEYRENGRIIGSLGFVNLETVNSCGTIGYALSKEYWGKGLMTEAVKRLIRFAFEEMKLNRIDAVHVCENEASGKVMQKAGMTYEGLLRQRLYSKGRYWDVKQYAILKDDLIQSVK